jgi:hypothetical protein
MVKTMNLRTFQVAVKAWVRFLKTLIHNAVTQEKVNELWLKAHKILIKTLN